MKHPWSPEILGGPKAMVRGTFAWAANANPSKGLRKTNRSATRWRLGFFDFHTQAKRTAVTEHDILGNTKYWCIPPLGTQTWILTISRNTIKLSKPWQKNDHLGSQLTPIRHPWASTGACEAMIACWCHQLVIFWWIGSSNGWGWKKKVPSIIDLRRWSMFPTNSLSHQTTSNKVLSPRLCR